MVTVMGSSWSEGETYLTSNGRNVVCLSGEVAPARAAQLRAEWERGYGDALEDYYNDRPTSGDFGRFNAYRAGWQSGWDETGALRIGGAL